MRTELAHGHPVLSVIASLGAAYAIVSIVVSAFLRRSDTGVQPTDTPDTVTDTQDGYTSPDLRIHRIDTQGDTVASSLADDPKISPELLEADPETEALTILSEGGDPSRALVFAILALVAQNKQIHRDLSRMITQLQKIVRK